MDSAISWEIVSAAAGRHFGEFRLACPACGPDRRSPFNQRRPVLKIWRNEEDFASYHCARCGLHGWAKPDDQGQRRHEGGVLWNALYSTPASPDRTARAEDEARTALERAAFAEFTYLSSAEIVGTPAEAYLAARGYAPGDNLKFAQYAPFGYQGDKAGPAMVGAVRNLAGEIVGCHVTHLNPDASKMRRTTFGRVAGGAIQLAPLAADGVLAVAEGIETALGFTALYGLPCWSALSAPGIASFEPPAGLKRLIVAADYDEAGAGLRAAQTLAKRARAVCEVAISMPARVGMDWDDAFQATTRKVAA